MAKKTEESKEQKQEAGITLKAGAVIRNAEGVPQRLREPLVVQVEDQSGRQCITSPEHLVGFWFDVREM
jgi:hypothetical protein